MKQTALQELITYFEQQKKQGCKNWCIEDLLAQLYQAKEMEKEQIIDAFDEGFTDGCRYTTGFEQTIWQEGELYYNETFKSE